MTISAAFKNAFRVYFGHPGAAMKFLIVEACMTLAAVTPLLFLTDEGLMIYALLAVPFWILLIFWARVNAAEAMRDALGGGSLFSYRLIEPAGYWKKLAYGLKRLLMLLFWGAPLIACLVIAKNYYSSGATDVFTLMRLVKEFGGGDLMTGILYLVLIFVAALLLLAFGCAFHSGDRHAFAHGNPKLVKRHHGRIILCWLGSLIALLPLIAAIAATVVRYLPALSDLNGLLMQTTSLPSTKVTLIILAAGAALTLPLLPLRVLIHAAYVDGLDKE